MSSIAPVVVLRVEQVSEGRELIAKQKKRFNVFLLKVRNQFLGAACCNGLFFGRWQRSSDRRYAIRHGEIIFKSETEYIIMFHRIYNARSTGLF